MSGIILAQGISYFLHIAPGTYATGTVVGWEDDPFLGRTYQIEDYAWVSRVGRMSTFADRVARDQLDGTGMLVEYVGGPPTLIGSHDIIRATPIAKAIKVNVEK